MFISQLSLHRFILRLPYFNGNALNQANFKFSLNFGFNYSLDVSKEQVHTSWAFSASTDNTVASSSSVYVNPIHILWGCIGKDTLIATSTGYKKVSKLQSTDRVKTKDGSFEEVMEILEGHCKTIYNLKVSKGTGYVQLSEEHGIMTKRGVVAAKDLTISDKVLTIGGEFTSLTALFTSAYEGVVYNIKLKNEALIEADHIMITDYYGGKKVMLEAASHEDLTIDHALKQKLDQWVKLRKERYHE